MSRQVDEQTLPDNTAATSVNTKHWVLFLGGMIVYGLFVAFGAYYGVRGADQYWYLADIATLVESGEATSKIVFPYTLAAEGYQGPRPFIHNIMFVYLSALPGSIVGPYAGAITVNAVSQIFTAFIIFLLICRLCSAPMLAALMAVLYVFFPMNYWLSINVLAEASLTPLIMVLCLVFIRDDWNGKQWSAAAVIIGVMIFARGSFLLLGVLLPLAYLFANRPVTTARLFAGLGLFTIVVGFNWFWGSYFEGNVPCSVYEQLNLMIPNKTSNMYCLFRMPDDPLMILGLIEKAIHNLLRQFRFSDFVALLFYWPTNLLILVTGFVLVKTANRKVRILGWLNLGLAAVQLGTLVLFQNQFRYLVILVPVSLVILAVWLHDHFRLLKYRQTTTVLVIAVLACVALDCVFALRARQDAIEEGAQMEQLVAFVDQSISPTANVLVESSNKTSRIAESIRIGFSLDPRMTLLIPDTYLAADYDVLLETFRPDFLILRRDTTLQSKLAHIVKQTSSDLPDGFEDYALYKATR